MSISKARLAAAFALVKEATEFFKKANGYTKPKVKPKAKGSDKAAKLSALVARLGCHATTAAEILSIVTGEKIIPIAPKETSGGEVAFGPKFMAIVPTDNNNSHSYPVGKVSIARNSICGFVRPDGSDGNSMTTTRSCLRLATDEEIKEMLKGLPESAFERMFGDVL